MPFRSLRRAAATTFVALLLLPATGTSALHAQSDRFFKPAEGFTQAKDLPEDFAAPVRSIQLIIKDVFEGSAVHSEAEAAAFDIGNKLHIESRPGTIRRRLLFREGDTVTKVLLLETEKALRAEQFLADAIIEAKRWDDGSVHLIVTTFDQWTTTLAFTPSFLGGKFYYLAGVVESNVLGSGQRLGMFYSHGRERDMALMEYGNKALTRHRLRLSSQLGWLSDGYSSTLSLSKPLETSSDRWAFSIALSAVELTEYVYFDANRLDELPDSVAAILGGAPTAIYQFDEVPAHDITTSVTRSFGRRLKLNVSATADWRETYNKGRIRQYAGLNALLPPPASAGRPEERLDVLAGGAVALYRNNYKTVRNFRNLKWNETIDAGWSLQTKAAMNQEWLGAKNHDFYLNHAGSFNNVWWDALYLNASGTLKYFVSPQGVFDNGQATVASEIQWKPHRLTASILSGSYGTLFATEQVSQFLLGEDSGLNGYPNAYYAGQAYVLLEAEQRYFPGFEFGTLVPALALYGHAGNTFPGYEEVDLDDLHYAVGLGLRLGFSKTTQKLVYHLNLSQPLDEPYLDGPVFSFRVKQNL